MRVVITLALTLATAAVLATADPIKLINNHPKDPEPAISDTLSSDTFLFEFVDDSGDFFNLTIKNSDCVNMIDYLVPGPYSCENSTGCGCTDLYIAADGDLNIINVEFKVCFDSGWCDMNCQGFHIPGELINNLYDTTRSSSLDAGDSFIDYVCNEWTAGPSYTDVVHADIN